MSFASEFHQASDKVIRTFEALGADWMFIGALPVAVWGQPRATTDADFAVSLGLLEVEALDRAMAERGLSKVEGPTEIPQKRLILCKYWEESLSFGVDVFLSSGYDTGKFQASALARKRHVSFDDRRYPVVSPEDLIVFKVLAYRQKDLDDVGGVLERQWAALDWTYLKEWAEKLGLGFLLKEVLLQYLEEKRLPARLPWE